MQQLRNSEVSRMTAKSRLILGDSLLLVPWVVAVLVVLNALPETIIVPIILAIITLRFILLRRLDVDYPLRRMEVVILCALVCLFVGILATGAALGYPKDSTVWPFWFKALVVTYLLTGMIIMGLKLYVDMRFSRIQEKRT